MNFSDPSRHISIKSAWYAVTTGAKTAANAAKAVVSTVTAAVRTGVSSVSSALKSAISKPTVTLGNTTSSRISPSSGYGELTRAAQNEAVQRKAAKSAGYIDQSFLGHGAMMAATGVEASKCFAYSQLENSIHLSTGTDAMAGSMLTPYVNAQATGTGTQLREVRQMMY